METVKNVDDDVNQMWERLDDKYGRTSKLTDAILQDIQQMKPLADGEDQAFVDMVNVVERCFKELDRIGMASEISNSSVVALIEERLPRDIKSKWSLILSYKEPGINDGDKFPSLIKFLQKH